MPRLSFAPGLQLSFQKGAGQGQLPDLDIKRLHLLLIDLGLLLTAAFKNAVGALKKFTLPILRRCLQSVLAIIELNVADRSIIVKTFRQNVEIWKFHGLIGRVSTPSKDVRRSHTTRGVEARYADLSAIRCMFSIYSAPTKSSESKADSCRSPHKARTAAVVQLASLNAEYSPRTWTVTVTSALSRLRQNQPCSPSNSATISPSDPLEPRPFS